MFGEAEKSKASRGCLLVCPLNLMKSIDRIIQEGKDIAQVLTKEIVEGIGREMMIK